MFCLPHLATHTGLFADGCPQCVNLNMHRGDHIIAVLHVDHIATSTLFLRIGGGHMLS